MSDEINVKYLNTESSNLKSVLGAPKSLIRRLNDQRFFFRVKCPFKILLLDIQANKYSFLQLMIHFYQGRTNTFWCPGLQSGSVPRGQNFISGIRGAADAFWHRFSAISAAPRTASWHRYLQYSFLILFLGQAFCSP